MKNIKNITKYSVNYIDTFRACILVKVREEKKTWLSTIRRLPYFVEFHLFSLPILINSGTGSEWVLEYCFGINIANFEKEIW